MGDPRLERPLWRGRTNVDRLTIACIERAESIGPHVFDCTQGSYQGGGGDENSAGTHDGGGVVDLAWCGHNECVRNLRQAGMFAWHRTPDQGPWPAHIHAGVLGHPLLAPSAARQEDAYRARLNGLADGGPDDGPRLNPIPEPVFPWPERLLVNEQDETRIRQIIREELAAFGANADVLMRVDHDNDPKTGKWSLGRILRNLKG